MSTLKELAQNCLDVQDACNPIAVAIGYGKAISELRTALQAANESCDHDAIKKHPINIWWINKIIDLSKYDDDDVAERGKAFDKLYELAEKT